MKYLFDEWGKIEKTLNGKKLFLFLDYDGTLALLADHPDKAILSDEVRNILRKVVGDSRFKVAVISGRELKDIKSKVGIREIIYSGNHGLEIEGPGFAYESNIAASYKKLLGKIKKDLHRSFVNFKGVFIEDKNLSLTVHYRLADKKFIPEIKKIIHITLAGYLSEKIIKARTGKMILEIVPPVKWNKGLAVKWILDRPEFLKNDFYPIYFGDDTTDEDAFELLKYKGLTVMVGNRKNSHAQYYVNDVTEVEKFAKQL